MAYNSADKAIETQSRIDESRYQDALARGDKRANSYKRELEKQEAAFLTSFYAGDFDAPAIFAGSGWTVSDAVLYALDVAPAPTLIAPPNYNDAWAVILEAAKAGQASAVALIARMAEASAYTHAKEPGFN